MKISNYFLTLLTTFLLYSTTVSAQTLSISFGEIEYDGELDNSSITLSAAFSVNDSFALEVSYNDFGKASGYIAGDQEDAALVTVESSSFDILLVGLIPLNEKINVFGKVGFSRWELESSFYDDSIGLMAFDDKGTDPTFAAGLEVTLNEKISGNIQWQRTQAEFEGDDFDLDKISLGLSFDL